MLIFSQLRRKIIGKKRNIDYSQFNYYRIKKEMDYQPRLIQNGQASWDCSHGNITKDSILGKLLGMSAENSI
ncbi:MAG: hypothetical protein M0Z31_10015 [Clostridia bacterium]|nr:hypothetical protein [Clostridia bacterium]